MTRSLTIQLALATLTLSAANAGASPYGAEAQRASTALARARAATQIGVHPFPQPPPRPISEQLRAVQMDKLRARMVDRTWQTAAAVQTKGYAGAHPSGTALEHRIAAMLRRPDSISTGQVIRSAIAQDGANLSVDHLGMMLRVHQDAVSRKQIATDWVRANGARLSIGEVVRLAKDAFPPLTASEQAYYQRVKSLPRPDQEAGRQRFIMDALKGRTLTGHEALTLYSHVSDPVHTAKLAKIAPQGGRLD